MGDDYSILNFFWTMLIISMWMMWIWVVLSTFMDNFRRTDHGGWAKAMWTVFLIFLPILGVLSYLIARPRNTPQDQQMRAQWEATNARIQGGSAVDDLATAQQLLSSGAIDQAEFDRIKTRVMATV